MARISIPTPSHPIPAVEPPLAWEQLDSLIPEPDAATLQAYAVRAPVAELIQRGATIRSERILTDLQRWISDLYRWWSSAPAATRESFLGFSDARLRVLAHHARVLRNLIAYDPAKAHDPAHTVDQADRLLREGHALRAHLAAVLEQACAVDPQLHPALETAVTPATDAPSLVASLRALVALAHRAIAPNALTAAALRADGVTDAALDRIDAQCTVIAQAHTRGAQGPANTASQDDIDAQDGVCLTLMEGLRRVFSHAHSLDTMVPLLVPIATRAVFQRRSHAHE